MLFAVCVRNLFSQRMWIYPFVCDCDYWIVVDIEYARTAVGLLVSLSLLLCRLALDSMWLDRINIYMQKRKRDNENYSFGCQNIGSNADA